MQRAQTKGSNPDGGRPAAAGARKPNQWLILLASLLNFAAAALNVWVGRPFLVGLFLLAGALQTYQWRQIRAGRWPPTAEERARELVWCARLLRVVGVVAVAYGTLSLPDAAGVRKIDAGIALGGGVALLVGSWALPRISRRMQRRPRATERRG